MQKRTEMLKRELAERYDFTAYGCFKTIDRDGDTFIDTNNLRDFFRNQGFNATEKEVVAIIRRMDTNGDAKITFGEF